MGALFQRPDNARELKGMIIKGFAEYNIEAKESAPFFHPVCGRNVKRCIIIDYANCIQTVSGGKIEKT